MIRIVGFDSPYRCGHSLAPPPCQPGVARIPKPSTSGFGDPSDRTEANPTIGRTEFVPSSEALATRRLKYVV